MPFIIDNDNKKEENGMRYTPIGFEKAMQNIVIAHPFDPEVAHLEADKLMREVLTSLGYKDGIIVYDKITKYYG